MSPVSSHAARLWGIVAEPKAVTAVMGIVYLFMVFAGFAAYGDTPVTVAHAIGISLSKVWGLTLILSGLCGVAGAIPGWYWLERAALIGGILSVTTYLLVIVDTAPYATLSGNYSTHGALTTAFLLMLIIRAMRIRGLTIDPSRAHYRSK